MKTNYWKQVSVKPQWWGFEGRLYWLMIFLIAFAIVFGTMFGLFCLFDYFDPNWSGPVPAEWGAQPPTEEWTVRILNVSDETFTAVINHQGEKEASAVIKPGHTELTFQWPVENEYKTQQTIWIYDSHQREIELQELYRETTIIVPYAPKEIRGMGTCPGREECDFGSHIPMKVDVPTLTCWDHVSVMVTTRNNEIRYALPEFDHEGTYEIQAPSEPNWFYLWLVFSKDGKWIDQELAKIYNGTSPNFKQEYSLRSAKCK